MDGNKREENGRFLSGNPGPGRPRTEPRIRELFEARTEEAVEGLWRLYETSDNEKLKARILVYWIDRLAGKPAQAITGADGGPVALSHGIDMSKLTIEQIEQLKAILQAAR